MHLGVPVEYENSIGMKFRLVPPGEFLMGSTPEEIEAELKVAAYPDWREKIVSEGPQHKVILTKPIYVGATEVTQLQYEQVMGTNPSHFSATGEGKEVVANLETSNHPVEMVNFGSRNDECTQKDSEYRVCQIDEPHSHSGFWTDHWFVKTDYNFGFNEWYFTNESEYKTFTRNISSFNWGKLYPKQ